MFAQLGNIRFELLSPKSFSDSEKWSYARHSVMGEKPVLQYTGRELTEINLSLGFHASFCVPSEKLRELREAANTKEPHTLLWGNGERAGDFVIEEISRTVENMDDIGNILSIGVDVKLTEHSATDKKMVQKKPLVVINSPKKKDSTVKPDIPKDEYPLSKAVRQGA